MMTTEDLKISSLLDQVEDDTATMAKGSRNLAAGILGDIQDYGMSENLLYRQGKVEGIASGYTAALRDLADALADTFELTPEAQDRLQGCILTAEGAWQDACRNHTEILAATDAEADQE